MRVKRFWADVQVTDQYARYGSDVEGYVRGALVDQLSGDLMGPRGGKYQPIGEIEFRGKAQVGDDFMRNLVTYRAQRLARYVRPKR